MAFTTTFEMVCGCGCGEVVTATDAGFHAVTVTVGACSARRAAGVVSVEMRKTAAFERAVPVVETMVRHQTGLVWMVG